MVIDEVKCLFSSSMQISPLSENIAIQPSGLCHHIFEVYMFQAWKSLAVARASRRCGDVASRRNPIDIHVTKV